MAKKFGKFLLFTAVASAAAAGVYYFLKEKDAPIIPTDDEDEDFDAFGDDQEETESNRTYVTITPEKPTESVAETVKKVFQEAKDTIVTKAASMKPFEGEKIEEFFDDEDEEEDTNE